MSSLKSGALLSLFTGAAFGAMQHPARVVEGRTYDEYPSPRDAATVVNDARPTTSDTSAAGAVGATRLAV